VVPVTAAAAVVQLAQKIDLRLRLGAFRDHPTSPSLDVRIAHMGMFIVRRPKGAVAAEALLHKATRSSCAQERPPGDQRQSDEAKRGENMD
jgi:hypothetical protein